MSKGASILLVDDDYGVRRTLGLLLEMQGYAVDLAANGREALAKLREGPLPSVLITDLVMPEMDGWQLRREMLKDENLSCVPVIVIAGRNADPESLQVVACLRKPIDMQQLYELLEAHGRCDAAIGAQAGDSLADPTKHPSGTSS
jgi:CheY-like chemotaxis protein